MICPLLFRPAFLHRFVIDFPMDVMLFFRLFSADLSVIFGNGQSVKSADPLRAVERVGVLPDMYFTMYFSVMSFSLPVICDTRGTGTR